MDSCVLRTTPLFQCSICFFTSFNYYRLHFQWLTNCCTCLFTYLCQISNSFFLYSYYRDYYIWSIFFFWVHFWQALPFCHRGYRCFGRTGSCCQGCYFTFFTGLLWMTFTPSQVCEESCFTSIPVKSFLSSWMLTFFALASPVRLCWAGVKFYFVIFMQGYMAQEVI